MKTAIIGASGLLLFFATTLYAQSDQAQPGIALLGGTLIDLSRSGHSTNDIPNAVVILREGKIEVAGPAALVKIPRNTRTLDYSGTYILPGLIDGFDGLNSQAQANNY
jgi:imidazolonepropionase-like amidohydrolase